MRADPTDSPLAWMPSVDIIAEPASLDPKELKVAALYVNIQFRFLTLVSNETHHRIFISTLDSMAGKNILDPYFVEIFPHMPPLQQRTGVDILKDKCAEIEGAGSTDAQLAMIGQADAINLPEDRRKAIVAGGLDQCYWQLVKFLRVSPPLWVHKHSFLISCSILPLRGLEKQHPI